MATGRKLVSDIRSRNKLISGDNKITDRVILSQIRASALLLIKRETNLRKLWATDTIFTTIPCLEMKEVSISECASYVDECSIARSVYKLPRISEGNYQYVIQGVYSINAMGGKGKRIKEITVNRYINLLKLPVIKNEEYFWVSNGYLYVTNPLLKAVRLVALFEEDVPNNILFPECDCGISVSLEERCKNPLDKEFPLPGYLEKQVMDLVTEELLKTYFNVKTDVSEEGLDGQASNMTALR
ncbi:MAG: hypothetical protein H5T96_09080 [Tissierellales bacterium]|nr:hypothetical protein [Tissierellales bacterium]